MHRRSRATSRSRWRSAAAEASVGVIPKDAAAAIGRLARADAIDVAKLKAETDLVGYPIVGVVHQLAKQCGEAGRYVHWGATTQDIMDTATVLQIRDALALVAADLAALDTALAALARKHRDTVMAGRTHLQHALPVTFGYKAAVWRGMVVRHRQRLEELKPRVLVGQFAGAAGTLASLGDKGLRRARRADGGAGAGTAAHALARRPRRPDGDRGLPRARRRHAGQDRHRRDAADADGGRPRRSSRSCRAAAPPRPCRRSATPSPASSSSRRPRWCASTPA
jgi:hypothetical protein